MLTGKSKKDYYWSHGEMTTFGYSTLISSVGAFNTVTPLRFINEHTILLQWKENNYRGERQREKDKKSNYRKKKGKRALNSLIALHKLSLYVKNLSIYTCTSTPWAKSIKKGTHHGNQLNHMVCNPYYGFVNYIIWYDLKNLKLLSAIQRSVERNFYHITPCWCEISLYHSLMHHVL